MKLNRAIEIVNQYVKCDRIMRDYNDTSDYEQQQEEKCVAMETLIKATEKLEYLNNV